MHDPRAPKDELGRTLRLRETNAPALAASVLPPTPPPPTERDGTLFARDAVVWVRARIVTDNGGRRVGVETADGAVLWPFRKDVSLADLTPPASPTTTLKEGGAD